MATEFAYFFTIFVSNSRNGIFLKSDVHIDEAKLMFF